MILDLEADKVSFEIGHTVYSPPNSKDFDHAWNSCSDMKMFCFKLSPPYVLQSEPSGSEDQLEGICGGNLAKPTGKTSYVRKGTH